MINQFFILLIHEAPLLTIIPIFLKLLAVKIFSNADVHVKTVTLDGTKLNIDTEGGKLNQTGI